MRSRYRLLVIIFALLTALWSVYLFSLQIFDPFNLVEERRVRYTPHKDILIPTRGSIYDANGDLLVSSITYNQIDVDREAVYNWAQDEHIPLQEAYRRVSKAIGDNCSIPAEKVYERLTMNDKRSSIQIGNKVRELELERILQAFAKQKIPGLNYSFSSMKRIYSQGILAARLLGSVQAVSDGYDPETGNKSLYKMSGSCGIEATYDKQLSGEYGWREVMYNARRERVPFPKLHEKPSRDGYNLHLTIDSNIQEIMENVLYEDIDKYKAKNAGAIAMDPKTGRILGMVGISAEDKTIDPGLVRVKSNIPVSFMFEPGSTMKPMTMLTAVENHLVDPNERIPCGEWHINGRRIADTHPLGNLRPMDIITKSSNVGIAKIAQRIGPKRLYEKFISLGYGQKTGLNLYGESSGIFAKLDDWDNYTLHSVSFGQNISVTALQHITAFCAIANGGKIMKPYVVDSVTDNTGQVIQQFEPEILREVASKAVTDTIRYYMQTVVDRGTARNVKMDYIKIAGKTGTAEKALEGGKGYSTDKYNSVFVGLFPADDPQMAILVFYDEPVLGLHWGSTSAAPTFKRMLEDILFMPNCNIIAFDDRLMQNSLKMPDLRGKHISEAESILNRRGFQYKIEGADSASVVIDQFPKPGVSVDPGHPITVKIGKGSSKEENVIVRGEMPDLSGLTVRKALQVAARQNLALRIKGSGIVRRQSIQPGSRITNHAVCVIEAEI